MRKRSTFGRILRRRGRDGEYLPGFYVRCRVADREVTRYAGPDRKTAAEYLAHVHHKASREHLFGEKAVASVTFAEVRAALDAYMSGALDHADRTVRAEKGRLDRIVAHFGATPLRMIDRAAVEDFLTTLKGEGLGIATRNRYASALSVAFRFAVERGYALENPVRGVRRPKEAVRPVPFLSSADVDRIVGMHHDASFAAFLRLLADTGLRRSEAVALEWRDVDVRRGVVVVRRSKTRKPREVPLTSAAAAAFERLLALRATVPMAGPSFVWPDYQPKGEGTDAEGQSGGALSRRFSRLAVRAGFVGLRMHDLRHGFCSRLAQAGVPIPTIAALAGHLSIATTMRYAAHLPAGATAEAIKRLETAEGPNPHAQGDAAGDAAKGASTKTRAAAG